MTNEELKAAIECIVEQRKQIENIINENRRLQLELALAKQTIQGLEQQVQELKHHDYRRRPYKAPEIGDDLGGIVNLSNFRMGD